MGRFGDSNSSAIRLCLGGVRVGVRVSFRVRFRIRVRVRAGVRLKVERKVVAELASRKRSIFYREEGKRKSIFEKN